MEQTVFYPSQNLRLFQELMTCGTSIFSLIYSTEGELLYTNCTDLVLDTILESTGCKVYMVNYAKGDDTAPLILSAPLGLMWCAAFQRQDGEVSYIRLIGPVFNTEISLTVIYICEPAAHFDHSHDEKQHQ